MHPRRRPARGENQDAIWISVPRHLAPAPPGIRAVAIKDTNMDWIVEGGGGEGDEGGREGGSGGFK